VALRKNGVQLGVSQADVFPHGCHLVPGSITEVLDCDEATGRRSASVDQQTGKPVASAARPIGVDTWRLAWRASR
jgi:hypothetical protein